MNIEIPHVSVTASVRVTGAAGPSTSPVDVRAREPRNAAAPLFFRNDEWSECPMRMNANGAKRSRALREAQNAAKRREKLEKKQAKKHTPVTPTSVPYETDETTTHVRRVTR